MSHNSYTASERRGIIAIAVIVLVILTGGICLTFLGRTVTNDEELPIVRTYPEMIDSTVLEKENIAKPKKKRNAAKKVSNKKTKTKTNPKKTTRHREPLEEPI